MRSADSLQMTTGESGEDNKSVIDKQMSNPAGRFDHAVRKLH